MAKQFIEKDIKRVAVIGGGPGGIAAARALAKEKAFDKITVFEINKQVGGTWAYSADQDPQTSLPSTDALKVDCSGHINRLNSAIYANLRTNLPKELMCYFDIPFDKSLPMFPEHSKVLEYLKFSAEDIQPMIRLSTRVDRVDPQKNSWTVLSTNLKTSEQSNEEFDAVVVATGHYNVPFVPNIPGVENLRQNLEVVHSKNYRTPDVFKDKTVLVIGGGYSALDIVRETSSVARKVYQSIRTQDNLTNQVLNVISSDVEQVGLIDRFTNTENATVVECNNGKLLTDIDVVIFGTGFLFSYPFLPFQKGNLIEKGQTVYNIAHFMFYEKDTTLCFLGLPIKVVPLPLMQRQSTVMAKYWSKKIPMLPFQHSEHDMKNRSHLIFNNEEEFNYNNTLGAWAEGWTDRPLEEWQSNDPVTGRLSDEWVYLRNHALELRKKNLGF